MGLIATNGGLTNPAGNKRQPTDEHQDPIQARPAPPRTAGRTRKGTAGAVPAAHTRPASPSKSNTGNRNESIPPSSERQDHHRTRPSPSGDTDRTGVGRSRNHQTSGPPCQQKITPHSLSAYARCSGPCLRVRWSGTGGGLIGGLLGTSHGRCTLRPVSATPLILTARRARVTSITCFGTHRNER